MTFRAFIAVEVPVFSKLDEFSRAVKGTGADLKMVNLDNVHITLKFLGDTDEALVPEIEQVIRNAVSGIEPFTMKLKGTGAFPNLNRISVVWAGLENAEALGEIAGKIDTGLVPLGFQPERRKFSPHVTVARVKTGRNKDRLADIIGQFQNSEFGEISVDRIILKKSVLTPQGPIYSDIITIPLNTI